MADETLAAGGESAPWARWISIGRRFVPRFETAMLLGGLVAVLSVKYLVVSDRLDGSFVAAIRVSLDDVAFFAVVAGAIAFIHAFCPRWLSTRLAIALAIATAGWAGTNATWLRFTGVQLHGSAFTALFREPGATGPVVMRAVVARPLFPVLMIGVLLLLAGTALWRLWRPAPLRLARRSLIMRGIVACGIAAGSMSAGLGSTAPLTPRLAALAYSSHCAELARVLRGTGVGGQAVADPIPTQGQREVVVPAADRGAPDVVVIIMEGVATWSTSLGGQPSGATPALSALVRRGVWMTQTRAVVTHTTQSEFAVLTGARPNADGGYAEAVLADRPYESLATLLRSAGYRTRFSQMVKAAFECNPGLVANLGFDSFWSRENLQDTSTHLGYLSGDDFRAIGPAFAWRRQQEGPTLMVFMTSVAHHPYEVPSWYGPTPKDLQEAYLLCVRYTDAFVDAVVHELEEQGRLSNTILCVISDHGQEIVAGRVREHNGTPTEKVLHIPWIISWPAGLPGGGTVSGLCSVMDVTPTILALLGADVSRGHFEGIDALGPIPSDRIVPFSGWYPDSPGGFVQGSRKVVYWPNLGRAYEFDVVGDPHENDPTLLGVAETNRVRGTLAGWRGPPRMTFPPRRYRERMLFGHWWTFSIGDRAWCYYVQ